MAKTLFERMSEAQSMTDTQAPDVVVTEADELRSCSGWGGLKIGRPDFVLITDDLRERILDRLSTQPAMQARIEELEAALRVARDYVDGSHDEGCELDPEYGEQNFDDEDETREWPADRKCTCGTDEILATIDATLSNIGGSNDG